MELELLQQLSLIELNKYTHELEHAVENHAKWLANVNRTLICGLEPEQSDLADKPHLCCHFGRWYHKIDDPVITSQETFRRIGVVHEQMHEAARQLLLKRQANEAISAAEYDELVEFSEELRFLLMALRTSLNRNRDITAKLMGKVFENASEGVVITDPKAKIISINKAFSEVTGYSEAEVIGQGPELLQSGRQDADFYRRMWHCLEATGHWQGEIWNRNKRGEIYLEWLSIAAVKDEKGEVSHYVGIFSDITTEKENEERLEHLAHYDQLTDLPNRILFNDRLRQALALARRARSQVAVMFLDLDGFKAINDSLGHAAGDDLLAQVAERLTGCLRQSDTVARFGGDEFTVVLPGIEDEQSVCKIAQKIVEEVARPYLLDGTEASVTTSIGISLYPLDGQQPDTLIHKADNAMYHAKRHGKNHYEFFGEGR
ncbi:MAG: diguanylate cyclase domain-containing protein [Pseudomonadota bacterium]